MYHPLDSRSGLCKLESPMGVERAFTSDACAAFKRPLKNRRWDKQTRRQLMQMEIPGPAGNLEGFLHLPEGDGPFPAVVVCHPHPQMGG